MYISYNLPCNNISLLIYYRIKKESESSISRDILCRVFVKYIHFKIYMQIICKSKKFLFFLATSHILNFSIFTMILVT